jgi:HAD superfamily hydrolase (TIGR01549 family)
MQIQEKTRKYVDKKYGYPHPTLDEIYNFWSKTNTGILKYKEIERKIELDTAVPNLYMREIFEYAKEQGKRIVISTDMYLQNEDIELILKKCNIIGWDRLLVSSEIKKSKYDGTLYDEILKLEKVRAGQVLHIGDNEQSDIQMASGKGFETYHYKSGKEDFAQSLHGLSTRQADSQTICGDNSFWYSMGYQIGGVLYAGLGKWIKEKIGNKKIFCVSRDGYNLVQLCKQLDIDNCEYLYSSRRALMLAQASKLDEQELELMLPYSYGQTIREVLEYMNLEKIPEDEFKKQGFSGYDDIIKNRTDIIKIKQIYKNNENIVLDVCRKEREELEKYFSKKGVFQKETYFFDSGWNGTTQCMMKRIFQLLHKDTKCTFLYVGICDNEISRKKLFGCSYETFLKDVAGNDISNKMLDAASVWELFFSADEPALICYQNNSFKFENYKKREFIKFINIGIHDYVEQNKNSYVEQLFSHTNTLAVVEMFRLVENPDSKEAEKIGNIENSDSASACKQSKKFLGRITRQALKKNPLIDIYWEKGIYAHPENTWDVKLFVFLRKQFSKVKRFSKKFNT